MQTPTKVPQTGTTRSSAAAQSSSLPNKSSFLHSVNEDDYESEEYDFDSPELQRALFERRLNAAFKEEEDARAAQAANREAAAIGTALALSSLLWLSAIFALVATIVSETFIIVWPHRVGRLIVKNHVMCVTFFLAALASVVNAMCNRSSPECQRIFVGGAAALVLITVVANFTILMVLGDSITPGPIFVGGMVRLGIALALGLPISLAPCRAVPTRPRALARSQTLLTMQVGFGLYLFCSLLAVARLQRFQYEPFREGSDGRRASPKSEGRQLILSRMESCDMT